MTHRFNIGQRVRFNRGFPYTNASRGDYQVVRQLPDEKGEFQYRIKSTEENHERVASESDLQPV